uniref:Uncharacterized protein n=1 Tax=Anguilla anguilla TaxID=7936 RepID=A0A0E9U2D7_ANGAN
MSNRQNHRWSSLWLKSLFGYFPRMSEPTVWNDLKIQMARKGQYSCMESELLS